MGCANSSKGAAYRLDQLCRCLMISYFQHFEGIFRILHAPSFCRHYDAF